MTARPPLTLLAALLFSPLAGAEALWTTDVKAAHREAGEKKKDLLLSFTGSDWCPGCIMLKERVLSKEEFGAGLREHFVFVELDYPRDQAGLSPEVLERNERFLDHYSVQEFPTLVLTDEEGRPYALTSLSSYEPKGVEDYVKHLLTLKAQRQVRDEALAAAGKLEGLEKAKALQAAIADYPDCTVQAFYSGVVEAIAAADPDDKTGFREAREYRLAVAGYEEMIGRLFEEGKFAEAIKAADAFVAKHDPTGMERQHILMAKLMATVETGTKDESLNLLEEIRAISPESEVGLETTRLKSRIEAFFAQQQPVPARPEAGQTPAPEDGTPTSEDFEQPNG